MIPDSAPALQLRRLTAGLLYPPMPLDRGALANFYAQASTVFDFTGFNLLPDGGRMAVGEDDLIIQNTRTQVNMGMAAPWEQVKTRAMAQFDAVRQFLRPPQFQAVGVKIIGFYNLGEPSGDYLMHRLIRPDADIDRLGQGLVGVGLRFNFRRGAGVWDVRIEPFFQDVSHIYIEVDAQRLEPFSDLKVADAWMDEVERFVNRETMDFIQNLPA
jgi:hypothetical protein